MTQKVILSGVFLPFTPIVKMKEQVSLNLFIQVIDLKLFKAESVSKILLKNKISG